MHFVIFVLRPLYRFNDKKLQWYDLIGLADNTASLAQIVKNWRLLADELGELKNWEHYVLQNRIASKLGLSPQQNAKAKEWLEWCFEVIHIIASCIALFQRTKTL